MIKLLHLSTVKHYTGVHEVTVKEVGENLLPCRECYDSFCGIPFDKPSNYEPEQQEATDGN